MGERRCGTRPASACRTCPTLTQIAQRRCRTRNQQKQRPGLARPSPICLRFDERDLGYGAPLVATLGPRARRAPLGLRPCRRQFVGLRGHRTIEEFEAELVAAVLVLVDDHTDMAA